MKGGVGNLGNLMKQAQKMQQDMVKAQEELGDLEVTGQAGGGMVSVVMNGKHEVKRVTVDDSLLGDDKDMLEDLVAAGFNDAVHKLEGAIKEKFSGLTQGMGLPDGFKLPF